uniref:Uncharacterized protein n=1 Tax=Timema poppense TaxID=170557 RepID=A0A7R9D3U0_TIMPO|nr:unnamed protein product [Timema poppensis]
MHATQHSARHRNWLFGLHYRIARTITLSRGPLLISPWRSPPNDHHERVHHLDYLSFSVIKAALLIPLAELSVAVNVTTSVVPVTTLWGTDTSRATLTWLYVENANFLCLATEERGDRDGLVVGDSECHLEGLTREPGESRVEAYFQAQGAGLTAAEGCSNPLLLPVTFGDGNNEKSEKCEEEITSSDECEGSSNLKIHDLVKANEIWSWYHVVIIPLTTCVLSDDLQVEGLQGQGVCRHLQYGGSALPQVAQLAHFLAVTVHDVDRRDDGGKKCWEVQITRLSRDVAQSRLCCGDIHEAGGTYDVDVFSGPRLSPYRSRAVVVQLCVNCFSVFIISIKSDSCKSNDLYDYGAGGTHRDIVASLRFPSFTGESECPCSRRVAASIEPHREQGGRLFERRATRLPVSHIFIGEQIDRPT